MSLILAVPVAAGGNALVDAPGPAERAASSRGSGVDSPGGWHYLSERRTAFRRKVDLHQWPTAEMLLHVLPQANLQHGRDPRRRPPHLEPLKVKNSCCLLPQTET